METYRHVRAQFLLETNSKRKTGIKTSRVLVCFAALNPSLRLCEKLTQRRKLTLKAVRRKANSDTTRKPCALTISWEYIRVPFRSLPTDRKEPADRTAIGGRTNESTMDPIRKVFAVFLDPRTGSDERVRANHREPRRPKSRDSKTSLGEAN